jgi:hypothetical protein
MQLAWERTGMHTVVLVEKTEGWRPLGRPKREWEDNIKMVLREVGWDWMTGYIWFRIGSSGELL